MSRLVDNLATAFAEKEGRERGDIADLAKAHWFMNQFSEMIRAEATKRHEKPKEFRGSGFDFDVVFGWLRGELSNE